MVSCNNTYAVTSNCCPPPIAGVRSINTEIGDVVLRKLKFGTKEYNGFEAVELLAADLGLEKAIKFQKTISTKVAVILLMDSAEVGDVYFCREDNLWYIATGEGEYRTVGGTEYLENLSKVIDTASKIALTVTDNFELSALLYDKNGVNFYTSEKCRIPFEVSTIITSITYDSTTKKLIFTMKDGRTISVALDELMDGFQTKITTSNPLAMSLISGLETTIASINSSIATEQSTRETNDNAIKSSLEQQIGSETTARVAAVSTEKTAREAKDSTLEASIANEIARSQAAESNITNQITAEETTRENADNAITTEIIAIKSQKSDYVGEIVGDGTTTEFIITHNLGTKNVIIQVVDTEGNTVYTGITTKRTTTNTITITFTQAPTTNIKYTVICYGVITFNIEFNANGGTGTMNSATCVKGYSYTLPTTTTFVAPTGKTFYKWGYNATTAITETSILISKDITLYAIWQ